MTLFAHSIYNGNWGDRTARLVSCDLSCQQENPAKLRLFAKYCSHNLVALSPWGGYRSEGMRSHWWSVHAHNQVQPKLVQWTPQLTPSPERGQLRLRARYRMVWRFSSEKPAARSSALCRCTSEGSQFGKGAQIPSAAAINRMHVSSQWSASACFLPESLGAGAGGVERRLTIVAVWIACLAVSSRTTNKVPIRTDSHWRALCEGKCFAQLPPLVHSTFLLTACVSTASLRSSVVALLHHLFCLSPSVNR